jgi:peptide deformylase
VPDYNAEVKRFEKIKVQYQNIDGLTQTLSADGLLAVALQHEMDHLDGKLFIDRLSPLKKEMIRKKLKQDRVFRDEEERMGVFDRGENPKERKKKGF